MKFRPKLTILIVIICLLLYATYFFATHNKNTVDKQENTTPFKVTVHASKLLCKSKEGYNEIKVYQQNHQLVLNATSETDFFDGAQFIVKTESTLSASDVQIIWTTLGGGTGKAENNDRIIAEIIVKQKGKIIFDKKINFLRKAFDAVEDVLEKHNKK